MNEQERKVMQSALEALESLQGGCTDHDDGTVEAITVWCPEIIDALRAALAAPQPEPGGWLEAAVAWEVCASIHETWAKGKDALYKTRHADFVKHADDARNRHAAAPQPEPPPEPIGVEAVAEVVETDDGPDLRWLVEGGICALVPGCMLVMPHGPITDDTGHGEVYAAPPLPEPLTDAKVSELRSQNGWAKETIRAIERAIRETKT